MQEVACAPPPTTTTIKSGVHNKWTLPVDPAGQTDVTPPERSTDDPSRELTVRSTADTDTRSPSSVNNVIASLGHLALNWQAEQNRVGGENSISRASASGASVCSASDLGRGYNSWANALPDSEYSMTKSPGYQGSSLGYGNVAGVLSGGSLGVSMLAGGPLTSNKTPQQQPLPQRRAITGFQQPMASFPSQLQQYLNSSPMVPAHPMSSSQQSYKGWTNPPQPSPVTPAASSWGQILRTGSGQPRTTTMNHGRSMSVQNISTSQYGGASSRRVNNNTCVNPAALMAKLAQQGRSGGLDLDEIAFSQVRYCCKNNFNTFFFTVYDIVRNWH